MRWAREHDVLVAVRGGGHNVAGTGTCDDGLVIDLLPMKGVRVEPASGTVRCQASLAWADLDYETQTFGLATTAAWSLRPGSAGSPSAVASAGCSALWPGLRTTFRLHEVGPLVTAGLVAYPYERAVEVLRGWHSAVVALPEAVHRTPHRLTGSGSAGRPGTAPLLAGSLMREERDRTGHASASAAP